MMRGDGCLTFSVITVTYNAEGVLGRTLDSVLGQDYRHIEHIIVDGASSDGTMKIVEDYRLRAQATEGRSVIAMSEHDDGLYDAMNKALRLATGDYIVFLNAGDTLPSDDVLSHIYNKVKGEDVLPAVIYGDTAIVDGEGNFLHLRRHRPPRRLSWRSFKYGMLVCHQAFYARRDIAVSIAYDTRYRYSADVDWCIRVMKEAERLSLPLLNANMVIANYVKEGQSTIHHKDSLMERFAVMRRHYGVATTIAMHIWFVVRAVWKA